jgi:hypothetical protein
MTSTLTVLSLASCLALAILCGYLCRTVSRMSKRDTPTPTTRQEDSTSEILTTMTSLMTTWAKEQRDLVTTLVLGREQPPPISPLAMPSMLNGKAVAFDYDSTPLAPGMEAILERETEETEQARLARERTVLQNRANELLEEWSKLEKEDSGSSPRHLSEERESPSPS